MEVLLTALDLGSNTKRSSLGTNYWKLWAASGMSNLGDGVGQAALPLLAATLTRDARLVGGLATAAVLPWLLFALISGALVDRLDRQRVMWTVNGVRAALVAVIAVAVTTDHASIWLLYVVAFCLGTAETLFDNAAQAMLPSVVAPAQLEAANGRQYAVEVVANAFAGPPLGALLFTVAMAAPFWVDSGGFVASAALIAWMRLSRTAQATAPAGTSLRSEIAEGLRWLNGHHVLRTLAIVLGIINFAGQMAMSTFVLFAEDRLGLGERGFGVLLAALAIGGVLGGLFAARLTARVGQARSLLVVIAGQGIFVGAVGFMDKPIPVGSVLAVNGFLGVWWNVITVSLRQQIVPDHLLGRVNSVYRTFGWGSLPLGALAGGFLAHATSLRLPWFAAGAICGVALAIAMLKLSQEAIDDARAAVP
jgi:MFS family permease